MMNSPFSERHDFNYPISERHDRRDVLPSPHRRRRGKAELRPKVFTQPSISFSSISNHVSIYRAIHPFVHFSIQTSFRAACESPISASNYLQAAKMWYKMHKIIKASDGDDDGGDGGGDDDAGDDSDDGGGGGTQSYQDHPKSMVDHCNEDDTKDDNLDQDVPGQCR